MHKPAFSRGLLAAACTLGLTAVAPAQVTLQLIQSLDGSLVDLNFGAPGSITAYGDRLYVGTINGASSQITQVNNPLTSPTIAGTLSGSLTPAGNGYVTLDTDGTTVVAATNNSGGADLVQVFDAATGALRYETNPAGLPTSSASARTRIDGAAIDPLTGNVWVTGFGVGIPSVLDANSLTEVSDEPSLLNAPGPTSTGWRDLTFSPTGDIYLRATNGVAAGLRNGTTVDDFVTVDSLGATAGLSQIVGGGNVNLQDSFQSAINIEFLPASFTGTEDLVITNTRNPQLVLTPFEDQVTAWAADAGFDGVDPFSLNSVGVAAPISWVGGDGRTPFTTAGSQNGIYDFSFDPVNEVLYISDLANGSIYAFGTLQGPSGIDGDYNNDGVVNAIDYTVYRDALGTPTTLPNDTTPGTVSSPGDYDVWANNYGATAGMATAVPEPASVLLVGLLGIGCVSRRR